MKKGLLIINLGTPNSTRVRDIKCYLRQFLSDKRVIDLPFFIRYLLVYGLIVPFRAKNTAHAYQTIWTEQGSPLLINSQNLVTQLQQLLAGQYEVVLGMRYGRPSIEQALVALQDCEHITVLPLYPQYSSAATGSSIEEVMRVLSTWQVLPSLHIIRDFYQHPAYISAQAQLIKHHITPQDYLLFSYHGIPERHIHKSGCQTVCAGVCPSIASHNQACYRAQCYQTTAGIAKALTLSDDHYGTAFQSRLGKTPWIKPYTDTVLQDLVAKGVRNLAVVCPSFTADCLETLEEIGLRAQEQWLRLGGTTFTLVPCLNNNQQWLAAMVTMVKPL